MNAFVACNEVSPDVRRGLFKQLENNPGVNGLYALLLCRPKDAGLKELAHNQTFWRQLQALTSERLVGVGVEQPVPASAANDNISLLDLFGWKSKDLPCLIICQPVQLLSSMRYFVIPLQRNGSDEPGRLDAARLLERVGKDLQIILTNNYMDGFCIFTAVEYSIGFQAAKRGLTVADAVWTALEDVSIVTVHSELAPNGMQIPAAV